MRHVALAGFIVALGRLDAALARHPQTGRPTVFVYDGHAGGVGIAQRGFEQFEGWVRDTAAMIRGCPCSHGCPSCVQSPKCGNLNEMLDKDGSLTFLQRLVDFGGSRSS